MMQLQKCNAKFCRNTVSNGKQCSKCKSREYRKKYPMRAAFNNLKMNAKRRGKEFSLTFYQFSLFATATNYIAGRGRTKESYHIDRIDEDKGYHLSNIQVLTNSENVKKYHRLKYEKDERGVPSRYWVEPPRTFSNMDRLPF